MPVHRIKISDERYEQFKELAELEAISVSDCIKLLAYAELERRLSGRKTRSPGRPVGDVAIREISAKIDAVYKRLREVWADSPERFEEVFESDLEIFHNLQNAKDLIGLENFYNSQPWLQKS